MKNWWFSCSGWGCICSTLILMWQAAGSESSVAPHVLKTILLILKGKPGEMQERITERKRFSLDITNMMPVAVNNPMSVSFFSYYFLNHENPYLPTDTVILPSHSLALIHSFIQHIFIECLLWATCRSWSLYSVKRHRQWTKKRCHMSDDIKLRRDIKWCGGMKVMGRV